MNAVEIESAVSALACEPFDPQEFPYAFLRAFGNKETTLKMLRTGGKNGSDVGGVLQTRNIHIAVAAADEVPQMLTRLRESPATAKARAMFILATDGVDLEAEDLQGGETLACAFTDLPDHFGFFLALAGITTVRQVRESSFDIRATARLNKLYLQLLGDNPGLSAPVRRHAMNHFLARLIFCFFAEDTDIFHGSGLFTRTVEQMSAADGSDTHEILAELFRAMNTRLDDRAASGLRHWADQFPYVNGGLFADDLAVPRFSKIARSYLLHIGHLDWKKINPDIFGSMIQAVADDDERGMLGMHYTSVPNILKVLDPLMLDELRARLDEAGASPVKLLNLRKRLARIRVFDPACGSGNFLVIAYKRLRELENTINERRGEKGRKSDIPVSNFRGIELRDFSAEVARLALIIAEYQCNVLYRGQQEALKEFLPLSSKNWITATNALRVDWATLCPAEGTTVRLHSDDLLQTPLAQAEIDFANEGGEVYLCGNPPYLGSTWQKPEQKADLQEVFGGRTKSWKSLDYVAGWFMKAADYCAHSRATAAFVTTNSLCQGSQVPILWPLIFATGNEIVFAHTSFKWANLASHNAGVTVAIVGISCQPQAHRALYVENRTPQGVKVDKQEAASINAYLVAGENVIVEKAGTPLGEQAEMSFGNKPVDGGHLLLTRRERDALELTPEEQRRFVRRIYGSAEFIRGLERYCLWIDDLDLQDARANPAIKARIESVRAMRLASRDKGANEMAARAHQMREMRRGADWTIAVPRTSSESRPYLPVGLLSKYDRVTSEAFALYDAPLWNLALIASRLHLVWIGTVCGKMKTDFRYSNTLGWNTFPLPRLTRKQRDDLTQCAENILLAREMHFPATIAELYAPGKMPQDLQAAHDWNDEVLERIYIGRRFRNDSERLEKLFALYTEMTAKAHPAPSARRTGAKAKHAPSARTITPRHEPQVSS